MSEEPQIDYDALLHDAFRDAQRAVMRNVLARVAQDGLPGDHHFYISFNTRAPGVTIAPRLLEKYPTEMTIVLQHRFWDLFVQTDRFEVKLAFDGVRERLVVPFSAVRVFFDPSVPYGLQFEDPQEGRQTPAADQLSGAGGRAGQRLAGRSGSDRKRLARKLKSELATEANSGEAAAPAGGRGKSGSKPAADAEASEPETSPAPAAKEKAPSGPRLVEPTPDDGSKVVRLDQFRKK